VFASALAFPCSFGEKKAAIAVQVAGHHAGIRRYHRQSHSEGVGRGAHLHGGIFNRFEIEYAVSAINIAHRFFIFREPILREPRCLPPTSLGLPPAPRRSTVRVARFGSHGGVLSG